MPHVGWNDLEVARARTRSSAVCGPEPTFYFVHSYEFVADDPEAVTGVTDYGRAVTATVGSGNVFGVQFHPEKSAADGLALLRGFARVLKTRLIPCLLLMNGLLVRSEEFACTR